MLGAVIFDLDDTLIDWSERQADWSALNRRTLRPIHEHLQRAGHPLPDLEQLVQMFTMRETQVWEAACAPEWIAPRQIDILRETLEALSLDFASIDLEEVHRLAGWDVIPGIKVFPAAISLLCTLRERGIKTGVLTNTHMPTWMRDPELRNLGLLEYLNVRLTAADAGRLKPHPEPFCLMLDRLGVGSDEAVFVGDRLHEDIVGAQSAGIRAIWIRRLGCHLDGAVKPNAVVDRLDEIPDILDIWFPRWR